MEKKRLEKYYCKNCGAWLGMKTSQAITKGILPYCRNCRDNVEISDIKIEKKIYKSCRSANK